MADERPSPRYMWLNGKMVRWEDATVHASLLGWSTVAAVFEGTRAYWNREEQQLYAWEFREHYRRFAQSMKVQRMNPRWSPDELSAAAVELLRANEIRGDAYIAPLAYFGDENFYSSRIDTPTHISIIARPSQSRLGSGQMSRAMVSSWTRIADNQLSPRVKCVSNYQNSRLAAIEARQNGYDQPILLNPQGKVAEGGAACLFLVRNGVAITPSTTSGILESITRETVLKLCADLGIPTQERDVERTELYLADEVFFCGTGAEVSPVASVDQYQVGSGQIGPITGQIESLFHRIVRGREPRYHDLVTPVYAPVASLT